MFFYLFWSSDVITEVESQTTSVMNLNELKHCDKEHDHDDNIKRVELWIKDMDVASDEAKKQFKSWFSATDSQYGLSSPSNWVVVREKYLNAMKRLSRCERYNKTLKKKRKDGTREHRKTSDYKDGKLALRLIADFIKNHLKESNGTLLAVSDIRKRFLESKESISELEVSLFRRHYLKMLLQQFPGAIYCRHKLQRAFANVALRSNVAKPEKSTDLAWSNNVADTGSSSIADVKPRPSKVHRGKNGYIYLLHSAAFPEFVKIGRAQNVQQRLRNLNSSLPVHPFELVECFLSSDYVRGEADAHKHFAEFRGRGEFFKMSAADAMPYFMERKHCFGST